MNKLIKGSIAAAAGVALLLGGAGSFALWNSTASVGAGTVSSGTLSLASGSVGPSWKNVSADSGTLGGVPISSITAYKIVPGDTLELTQVLSVTATGDNLKATLSYDDATIAAATPADTALKSALLVALDATGGANVTRIGTTQAFAVVPATGVSTVTVKLTVTLPTTVSGSTAQAGTVDLSAIAFKLQQNSRP